MIHDHIPAVALTIDTVAAEVDGWVENCCRACELEAPEARQVMEVVWLFSSAFPHEFAERLVDLLEHLGWQPPPEEKIPLYIKPTTEEC